MQTKKQMKEYMKGYRQKLEVKQKEKEYRKKYYQKPEVKLRQKQYYKKNKEKLNQKIREYQEKNKEKIFRYNQRLEIKARKKKYMKEYTQKLKNKERANERARKYSQRPEVKMRDKKYNQRLEVKARVREYCKRPEVKKKKKKYNKEYFKNHREQINKRLKKKWRTNKNFNIRMRLGNLLRCALNRYTKTGKVKTSKKYGINYKAIMEYLKPFPEDLSNYEIDHRKPLCSFNLEDSEEIKKAFAPENHQWLTIHENRSKGGRY